MTPGFGLGSPSLLSAWVPSVFHSKDVSFLLREGGYCRRWEQALGIRIALGQVKL